MSGVTGCWSPYCVSSPPQLEHMPSLPSAAFRIRGVHEECQPHPTRVKQPSANSPGETTEDRSGSRR
jgi:hypothetical protein